MPARLATGTARPRAGRRGRRVLSGRRSRASARRRCPGSASRAGSEWRRRASARAGPTPSVKATARSAVSARLERYERGVRARAGLAQTRVEVRPDAVRSLAGRPRTRSGARRRGRARCGRVSAGTRGCRPAAARRRPPQGRASEAAGHRDQAVAGRAGLCRPGRGGHARGGGEGRGSRDRPPVLPDGHDDLATRRSRRSRSGMRWPELTDGHARQLADRVCVRRVRARRVADEDDAGAGSTRDRADLRARPPCRRSG